MDFKIVECPDCKKKQILWYCTTGTTCKCGLHLLEDTKENRKDVRKENAEFASCFSKSYDDFYNEIQKLEEQWNKENRFINFQVLHIPDDILIKIAEENKCGKTT